MTQSFFSAEFFRGNRQRLRQAVQDVPLIVITAHGLLQRSNDVTYPFRQDSNFWYLTGIDEPDVILVVDRGEEFLIVPEHDDARVRFEGDVDRNDLRERSGIRKVYGAAEGWQVLGRRLKRLKRVASLAAPAAYIEWHNFYTNPARAGLISKMQEYNPGLKIVDVRERLAGFRKIKQPAELRALRAGVELTIDALQELRQNLKNYAHEYEIEAFVTQYFRSRAAAHGYDPMVAYGLNACTAHHMHNNSPLTGEGLLLLDVGAEVDHYAADISRVFALRSPTKRQRAVHDAVLDIQAYALTLARPGATIRGNEKLVEKYMGQKLQQLGLIKDADRESIRRYYPHSTSHYLGLDVHDAGDYDAPLEPGMVLTIEPGIYIPEEKIGVRIEDDILITADGCQVLSKRLPRSL